MISKKHLIMTIETYKKAADDNLEESFEKGSALTEYYRGQSEALQIVIECFNLMPD